MSGSEIGTSALRQNLREEVDRVQQGETRVISRHGKPAAAMVPLELYEKLMEEREKFFENLQDMQEETDMDPEDAMELAREGQKWAREQSE